MQRKTTASNSLPDDWEMVQLHTVNPDVAQPLLSADNPAVKLGATAQLRASGTAWGTQGYVVSRKGLMRICANAMPASLVKMRCPFPGWVCGERDPRLGGFYVWRANSLLARWAGGPTV